MLKTLIIDDEKSGREIVTNLLTQYCPNISIIGEAESVQSGILAINQLKPQLVMLDVNMQDGTGFDLLKQVQQKDFKVIFVTAFQDYAIKAFQFSAIDYLLKPVSVDNLINAVNKAEEQIERGDLELKLSSLLMNINQTSVEPKKIILKTAERIYAVDLKDIVRCESHDSYTQFYLSDGKKILVSRQLKEFDEMLNGNPFIRIHQSHLINLKYFDYFEKSDDKVFMKDKSSVPVATRKKEQLMKLISEM